MMMRITIIKRISGGGRGKALYTTNPTVAEEAQHGTEHTKSLLSHTPSALYNWLYENE